MGWVGFGKRRDRTSVSKAAGDTKDATTDATTSESPPPATPDKKPPMIKVPRASANVLVIKLGQVEQPVPLMAGDAVTCDQCQAVLSSISHITSQDDSSQWTW